MENRSTPNSELVTWCWDLAAGICSHLATRVSNTDMVRLTVSINVCVVYLDCWLKQQQNLALWGIVMGIYLHLWRLYGRYNQWKETLYIFFNLSDIYPPYKICAKWPSEVSRAQVALLIFDLHQISISSHVKQRKAANLDTWIICHLSRMPNVIRFIVTNMCELSLKWSSSVQ